MLIVLQIPLERDDDDYGSTPFIGLSASQPKKKTISAEAQKSSAIDITAEDLLNKLTPQNVADLVLLSMVRSEPNIRKTKNFYCELK